MPVAPNFDRIARPYRWLEYLTLGPALHRCRLHFLPQLLETRRALVLGDGDGRFVANLLARNPHLQIDAVDLSPAMLHLLRRRASAASPSASNRLRSHQGNALSVPLTGTFDLVVTHFFLDCLTGPELHALVTRLKPHLSTGALWLLSDFRIPPGPLRLPARILVRLLYLAFRLLTGLRVTSLPHHAPELRRASLVPVALHRSLGGILTTEIWQHHPSGLFRHPTGITTVGALMTTPSPVPSLPSVPGTDLPSSPVSDPIPGPEPVSPSIPDPAPGYQE